MSKSDLLQNSILGELLSACLKDCSLNKALLVEKHVSLEEVHQKLVNHRMGSLIVTDNGRPRGIVTERDFLKKVGIHFQSMKDLPVEQLMTAELVSFDGEKTLLDATALFSRFGFRHLPVIIDEEIFILSIKDVLAIICKKHQAFLAKFGNIVDWQSGSVRIESDDIFDDVTQEKARNLFLAPLSYLSEGIQYFDRHTTLEEALGVMKAANVGHAVVKDFETEVAGIVTERDFLFKYFGHEAELQTVADIMTIRPHTLNEFHFVAHGLNNMMTFGYRQVLIVNFDRYPVGSVTLLDILNFFVRSMGAGPQFVE